MFPALAERGYLGLKYPRELGGSDRGHLADAVREVTEAKLLSQRTCFEVMDGCLQLGGERGYFADPELQRAARDARVGLIGGGTDEIMKEILGKTLPL